MKRILDLADFPRGELVARFLAVNADTPPAGVVAQLREGGDQWGVRVFGAAYECATAAHAKRVLAPGGTGPVYLWIREPVAPPKRRRRVKKAPAVRDGSRTAQAVSMLIEDPRLRPAAAARAVGVHPSAVYRALERTNLRCLCPRCGQALPKP